MRGAFEPDQLLTGAFKASKYFAESTDGTS